MEITAKKLESKNLIQLMNDRELLIVCGLIAVVSYIFS